MSNFRFLLTPLLLVLLTPAAELVLAGGDLTRACQGWADGNDLICPDNNTTAFVVNGVNTQANPAVICHRGPGGGKIETDGNCYHFWLDDPENRNSHLVIPWKTPEEIDSLTLKLEKLAKGGVDAGWCSGAPGNWPVPRLNIADKGREAVCRVTPPPDPDDPEPDNPPCESDVWKPDPAHYFANQSFTQTNECGVEREAFGCGGPCPVPCFSNKWSPDPSTVLLGRGFLQKNECGKPRPAVGTAPRDPTIGIWSEGVSVRTLGCDEIVDASSVFKKFGSCTKPGSHEYLYKDRRNAPGCSCEDYGQPVAGGFAGPGGCRGYYDIGRQTCE